MRIVRGAAEARQTLLRRVSMDEPDLPPAVRETVRRAFGAELDAAAVVDRILRDVREEGDAAVRRYNQQIDGVTYEGPLEVPRSEVKASYSQVDSSLVDALRLAAGRIRDYHALQMKHAARSFEENGLGQLVRPIERVGLYIPGNKVIYPSTLLMTALPARAAGVGELVMVTPARKDGSVAPVKLVAADIASVDRIFRAGGVQGIAALAYGTDSVPRVDKICGPGNIFVTIAKQRLFGQVGIDGIFGPSETLVIADASADPRLVAADMLAGAEHDELATAILLTDSEVLANEVSAILERAVASIPRADAARTSLAARGGAVVLASIEEAVHLASDFAAEHLCLQLAHPERWLERIRNAGCVFAGEHSVESVGDYTAGPSHVMPTGGSARFSSALGVHDFLKVTSLIRLDPQTVAEIGPAGVAIAYAEGLAGHARAIESRLPEDKR
ncbi:MAG: histidinol dehydrogenase [Chloroflexota bacterium]|nr:histidinol dehydrogenase [Chloroflexota bacterium]